MESLSDLIIAWNLRFKYDRRWRKKYNVAFGSEEHLKINQIDVFLDLREDKLFEKFEKEYTDSIKDQKEYQQTGKFLKERHISKNKEDELIKKLKLSFK